MPMTPEIFADCAQIEKQMKENEAATGLVVTDDTLRGCIMAGAAFAARLGLSASDFAGLASESFETWGQYLEVKKRLIAKKKRP